MTQRTRSSQPQPAFAKHVSPGQVALGLAAGAAAVYAGKWLHDNQEKVTMIIGDIADSLTNSTSWNAHDENETRSVKSHPPTVGQTGAKSTGRMPIS